MYGISTTGTLDILTLSAKTFEKVRSANISSLESNCKKHNWNKLTCSVVGSSLCLNRLSCRSTLLNDEQEIPFTTPSHNLFYGCCVCSTCYLLVMNYDAIWGWLDLAGFASIPNYIVIGHSYRKSPLQSYQPLTTPATKKLLNLDHRNSSTELTVRPEDTLGGRSTCRKEGAWARCTRGRISVAALVRCKSVCTIV